MYCEKCGTENANGTKFCKGCGAPLNGVSLNGAQQTEKPAGGIQKPELPKMPKMNKPVPKKAIAGTAAAVVVIAAAVSMTVNSGKTIQLDKYLTVEADGYDGYGTAQTFVDWDAIEKKYGSKLEFTKEARMEYGSMLKMMDPMDFLEGSVAIDVDQNYDLSNGDTISYTWIIDDDVAKYLNCKVKGKDGSTEVSGLEEIGTFDAFADLSVTFSGMDSNGWVEMDYHGHDLESYDFNCDAVGGLKNGDTVRVYLNNSSAQYYAEYLGKVPEAFEKEYTVNGLSYYLSKTSEISEEAWTQMKQQASDVYQAKAAKKWGDGEELQNLSYLGSYLLTSKDGDSKDNNLFLVYKAQIRDTYANNESSYDQVNEIYWYIRYTDLIVDSDGVVNVDVTSYDTPDSRVEIDTGINSGWWSTKSWSYDGYDSLDALYRSVVTANLDHWNHEDNITGE